MLTLPLAEDDVELCTSLAVVASSPYFKKPAAVAPEAGTPLQPRALSFEDAPPACEPSSRAIVPVRAAYAQLAPHAARIDRAVTRRRSTYSTVLHFRPDAKTTATLPRTRTLTSLLKSRQARGTSPSGSAQKGRSAP